MMRKLDNRGVAAFEMVLVFVPLFTLMFVIFDLGRYAITMQSLRTLANAAARAVIVNCYTQKVTSTPPQSPSGCTCTDTSTDIWCLSTAARQNAAPFLYLGSLTPPTLSVAAGTSSLTATAWQSDFTMIMPIWGTSGTALNAPSASTTIPF
jgi:Flp pilus assembly protein TadG